MNESLQSLFQERKTRKFIGISNPQIRAEITENANSNFVNIRPNPTCHQCRKLVEEVTRLRLLLKEGLGSMQLRNPGWKDDYAEDPEQISPRVNAAFVYKKSQSKAEEIQQLRSEVTRLQRELRLRSEEVYRLRGVDIKDTSQHQGTSKPKSVRDHHTLGDTDSKVKSMYLQLYQREWSQAYAHQKHGGVAKNTAHGNLLNIILLSFSQCREIADEQLTQILQASSLWAPKTSPHSPENPPPQSTAGNKQRTPPRTSQQPMKRRSITSQDDSKLSNPLYKDAVSFQRRICEQLLPHVQQRVSADIMKVVDLSPAMKSSAVIRTYTNCCIQTAWKIAMETDQVHLDNSVVRFSDFDTVKYDFYDEELENFDYVVWPALLSGNSQLIAKGVAMATSKVR